MNYVLSVVPRDSKMPSFSIRMLKLFTGAPPSSSPSSYLRTASVAVLKVLSFERFTGASGSLVSTSSVLVGNSLLMAFDDLADAPISFTAVT